MSKPNQIDVEILPDGRVKLSAGKIGAVDHASADEFVKFLEQKLGGPVQRGKAHQTDMHTHSHQKQ
jgi:hypothetical protein